MNKPVQEGSFYVYSKFRGENMSGNDYLKYVTEQVVSYLDLPAEEKKKRKSEQKQTTPGFSNRWLGVLPFMIKSIRKKAE